MAAVRRSGRLSWQLGFDQPFMLMVALYIRDAAGIAQTAAPIDLPRLDPPISVDEVSGQAAAWADREWNDWWARVAADPSHPGEGFELEPDLDAFAATPTLRALLREHFAAAVRWSHERKREFVAVARATAAEPGRVVREVERLRGRSARPFRLDVAFLPVAGNAAWRGQGGLPAGAGGAWGCATPSDVAAAISRGAGLIRRPPYAGQGIPGARAFKCPDRTGCAASRGSRSNRRGEARDGRWSRTRAVTATALWRRRRQ